MNPARLVWINRTPRAPPPSQDLWFHLKKRGVVALTLQAELSIASPSCGEGRLAASNIAVTAATRQLALLRFN